MFGDGFFDAYPFSFPRFMDDSLWQNVAGGDSLEDQVMDVLEPWADRDLVLGPRAWVRPRPRWCPYTCGVSRPRRPTRRHFMILPLLASDDATSSGGCHCGTGALGDSLRTKGKDSAMGKNSPHRRKRTASTCSVSIEDSTNRKQRASASSVSSEGCSSSDRDSSARSSSTSTDVGKTLGESPWQFSVDTSGCDEVRALTEGGMLLVEGRGSSDSSHMMMRYITSLPHHVSHDSLTARLSNGRLTVSQKPGAPQVEGQPRMLLIDSEQQQQQQTQQVSENTEQQEELESKGQQQSVTEACKRRTPTPCKAQERERVT